MTKNRIYLEVFFSFIYSGIYEVHDESQSKLFFSFDNKSEEMSNKNLIKSNSSSTNLKIRSKKLPPPPLCLPASNTTTDEEQQYEQKISTNTCCPSSKECSHEYTPYVSRKENFLFVSKLLFSQVLSISQRPQILKSLINSSSTLLVPPIIETKQRKSQTLKYFIIEDFSFYNISSRQHQALQPGTVTDSEWLDFIRLIISQPLENDIKMLLDKYKMVDTYLI
jgi:hypothetical protein